MTVFWAAVAALAGFVAGVFTCVRRIEDFQARIAAHPEVPRGDRPAVRPLRLVPPGSRDTAL